MRPARRAGIHDATSAINASTAGTATNVSGSSGEMPGSMARMAPIEPNAPSASTRPITRPMPVSFMPCPTTMPSSEPGEAPSASRMPISCVRWLTAYDTTP